MAQKASDQEQVPSTPSYQTGCRLPTVSTSAQSELDHGGLSTAEIAELDAQIKEMSELSANAANWLLASILAANGAGALATVSAFEKLASPVVPGVIFVFGLLLAIGSGSTARSYWDGQRKHLIAARAERRRATVEEPHRPLATALGLLSGLLFAGGTISLAYGLEQGPADHYGRCAKLERMMLAYPAPRDDARELFVTLGCRSIGIDVKGPARSGPALGNRPAPAN